MENENLLLTVPDQDDRIMAAISHITILVPFMGIIGPIVIWATQKDNSRYVAFQALQAAVFQISLVALGFIGFACYILTFFGAFLIAIVAEGTHTLGNGGAFVLMPFLPLTTILLILAVNLVFIITGIVAAVMTLQGRDFRYPIIGNYLASRIKF